MCGDVTEAPNKMATGLANGLWAHWTSICYRHRGSTLTMALGYNTAVSRATNPPSDAGPEKAHIT